MKNWQAKKLGDIAVINPSKEEVRSLPPSTSVSFVSMASISAEAGTITQTETKKLEEVKNGYTYFAENDVLFAKITPCMENGKIAIAKGLQNGIGFGTTEVYTIRTSQQVLPEWIYTHLKRKSFRKQAEKFMIGSAGQKRVPKRYLENVIIQIPPLSIQQRITKKLDAVRKLQELNQKEIERAEELFNSFIVNLLQPKPTWSKKKLGEIVSLINGRAFKPSEWKSSGMPIIRIQNLNNVEANFNYHNGKYDNKHLIKNGDLLFSWSGNLGTSFGAFIWGRGNGLLNQHIYKVQIVNKDILKIYLFFVLTSLVKNIEKRTHGAIGLVHITKKELEKTIIHYPKPQIQQEIVDKLMLVRSCLDMLQIQKSKLIELFDGVLNKFMKPN